MNTREALKKTIKALAELSASSDAFDDLIEEAQAALDKEPDAWLVGTFNEDGTFNLEYATSWEEAAHEHINDAINEFGVEGAETWVVRPAYI